MEERLGRLERENWWLKLFGILVVVILSAVMLMAMGSSPREATAVVEAKRFVVKDTDGKVRAELGPTAGMFGGGLGLSFYDSDGKRQGTLFAGDDAAWELSLIGRHGGAFLSSKTDPVGGIVLVLFDKRGEDIKNIAGFGLLSRGGVGLALSGGPSLAVQDGGSPRLTLSDKDGKVVWDAP